MIAFPERVPARTRVGRRSVRCGSYLRKQAKSGRTVMPKDRRAGCVVALAPRDPSGRERLHAATRRGDLTTCTSTDVPGELVHIGIEVSTEGSGSSRMHVRGASAGIGSSLPVLERTPRMIENRPKAPWCEGDRPSRPSPHHGAASSRMELARARRLRRRVHVNRSCHAFPAVVRVRTQVWRVKVSLFACIAASCACVQHPFSGVEDMRAQTPVVPPRTLGQGNAPGLGGRSGPTRLRSGSPRAGYHSTSWTCSQRGGSGGVPLRTEF